VLTLNIETNYICCVLREKIMQLVIANLALGKGRYKQGIEGQAVKQTSADGAYPEIYCYGQTYCIQSAQIHNDLPLFCIQFSYTGS
jgi:hypothetical protein